MTAMTDTETYRFWSLSGYTSEHAVADAKREFNVQNTYGRIDRDPIAQMCLRGLSYLLWNTGDCVGTTSAIEKLNFQCSVARIKDAFEEYSEEALEEQKELFEDDKEWFFRHYRCENLADAEHPWGKDEFAVMEAWLALDPFEWFLFTKSVKEAGMDAIEDNLNEFVVNEDDNSSYVHKAIRRASDTLMERFATRVKGVE